jgi:hypothetical protein
VSPSSDPSESPSSSHCGERDGERGHGASKPLAQFIRPHAKMIALAKDDY